MADLTPVFLAEEKKWSDPGVQNENARAALLRAGR
jgi:hypothetical protein